MIHSLHELHSLNNHCYKYVFLKALRFRTHSTSITLQEIQNQK